MQDQLEEQEEKEEEGQGWPPGSVRAAGAAE